MNLPDSPFITIITATWNRREKLKRALESVLQQTNSSWELIIVDDGSTDGTAEDIAVYQKQDSRIRGIIFPRNRGVNVARNSALRIARGQWIVFLDSDNQLVRSAVADVAQIVKGGSQRLYFFRCGKIGGGSLQNYEWPREVVSYREYLANEFSGEYLPVIERELLERFPLPESVRGGERITWTQMMRYLGSAGVRQTELLVYDDTGLDRLSRRSGNIHRLADVFSLDLRLFWEDYLKLCPLRLVGTWLRWLFYSVMSVVKSKPAVM